MKKRFKLLIILIICILCFNPISLKNMLNSVKNVVYSDSFLKYNNDSNNLENKEYEFDTNYYPYYGFLNDEEKILYRQIYMNASELVETFKPFANINIQQLKKVFEAIYNDHPELFWLDTNYSYKYNTINKCIQITLNYNETKDNIEYSKKIFNETVDKIINDANKLDSDYEKEKYVHDYILKNVKYDKNAKMNQSAYSALINKRSICAGLSRAFQLIMIKLNIPTYYCVGVSSVNHAWNIVKLDDGYYNVDLTWNNSDITEYKYFNKTDEEFSITHTRTGLSLELPKCESVKYSIKK